MRCMILAGLLAVVWPASAQFRDEVPLADVLEVMVIDRQVVAIDARSGGQRSAALRLDEDVVWKGARGRVGVVLTNQRVLAISVGSGAWQSEDRDLTEVLPESAMLGDRVALILTSSRMLGFDGGSGNIVESRLGVREQVLAARAGENAAVVVTDRRALGVSPQVGGFFQAKLHLEENLESVDAGANLATVTTDRRLLIFRAPTGSWEESRRNLR